MNWLKDREFTEKLYRLTLPIAIQSFMLAAVAAADALMLGTIEQNTMAAVSLAALIQFVQNMAVSSIMAAFAILGAQYWGKGDKATLNDIFCIALRSSGVLSIAFFVACVFFPHALMRLLTNEPVLIEIGIRYLRIAGWSYLLTGISQCYHTMLKVSEHPGISARISTVTVLANIVLNAAFIYGFHLGERGAAIATLISRVFEIFWVIYIFSGAEYIKPKLARLFHRNRELTRDFRKCVLPLIGASLFWGIGFSSYSAFMGHLGADAAAANSVASVVRDLVCCLCNGISVGGGILVGNELGAGNLERGRLYGDRVAIVGLLSGAVSMLLMLALTPPLLHFVKLTDEAQRLLIGMMIIMAIYMIGRAINTVVINGIFAAGGDTIFDLYSLAVCMWGLAIPLAAAGTFLFHWPVLVVSACLLTRRSRRSSSMRCSPTSSSSWL